MPDAKPQVMMQGFYKRGKFVAVPSPHDNSSNDWWWDHLAKQAHALHKAGFTMVWLPPITKAAQGASAAALGYSVYDDYDIGGKVQKGTLHTRYGTREQLARCVAMFRANGIDVLLDIQDNHRKGGSGPDLKTFRYVDAFGNPTGGRFEKDPSNFHSTYPDQIPPDFEPEIPQDPNVPVGIRELQPSSPQNFGPDLAPINGKPSGYVFDGLVNAADWMSRALDVQGYRIDHVPGLSTDFLRGFLSRGAMAGKFAVGEYFTGDVHAIREWITNPAGMNNRCSAFDFPLWGTLLQMCNHPANFDMSSLDHAGLAGVDPLRAVTFVENHDTESRPDILPEHINQSKMLAYAYILTSEGLPCVFYKDYSTDPECLGLKPFIDNLVWIHQNIAAGGTQQRWKDREIFAYERLGGDHLLIGLNNNRNAARTIHVDTGFGANVTLHDYTGHAPDVRTDGNGRVSVTLPRNQQGLGYVCYAPAGIGDRFSLPSLTTTQDYEGAADLDIPPADDTQFHQVCRIWAAQGKPIVGKLQFDSSQWTANTFITLELLDPSGNLMATQDFGLSTPLGTQVAATPATTDQYRFRIRSSNTPSTNARPSFKLTVSYQSPQEGLDVE